MSAPARNSHCSYCGARFAEGAPWPRTCGSCGSTSFVNPLPVAVLLLEVGGGVLAVRRSIPPRAGSLALPGGYIGVGETWQAAGARELLEETGVAIDPATVELFTVSSAPDGTVLIFGAARWPAGVELPPFTPNDEAGERTVLAGPAELAFPLHTAALRAFFERR